MSNRKVPKANAVLPNKDENDWEVVSKKLSNFFKIIYLLKLVIGELLIYLALYYAINMMYRFALSEEQQMNFSKVVKYFDKNLGTFSRDLTFLLGFYVSIVAKRWWDQYRLLPWPDNLAMTLSGLVVTSDAESLTLRQTIVRYALLSYVLCIRRFSSNLKRRLPTVQSIIDLGLVRQDEVDRLNINDFKEDNQELLASNWWLPLAWAANIVKFGKIRKHIPSDNKELIREILRFRGDLESVESHVHVAIPLVYKLVVTSAVYLYFFLTLIGSQNIGLEEGEVDLYFPLFIVFKLVLFIGWLKVAKAIESPYGEDDADFQMHSLLVRHMRTTTVILDEFDDTPPPFDKASQEEFKRKKETEAKSKVEEKEPLKLPAIPQQPEPPEPKPPRVDFEAFRNQTGPSDFNSVHKGYSTDSSVIDELVGRLPAAKNGAANSDWFNDRPRTPPRRNEDW